MADSVRHFLRQATRDAHEGLERRLDIASRCRSVESYRDLLEGFHGYYAPLEARLGPWLEELPGLDFARRRKTSLLERDLRFLAGDGGPSAPASQCPDLPNPATVAAALGCAYVLEGATLGGQLIRNQMAAGLGLDASGGLAFFSSYGASVGEMWRDFCAVLETYCQTDAARTEAAAAARHSFAALDAWMMYRRDPVAGGRITGAA